MDSLDISNVGIGPILAVATLFTHLEFAGPKP